MVIWLLWPWPLIEFFFHYWTFPSFYHSSPYCQSSSKSVNDFLSYWGNSLKTVFFKRLFDSCDVDLLTNFLTIKLSFLFINLYHPAKAHQNWSITFVETKLVWQTDKQTDRQTDRHTNKSKNNTSYHFVMEVITFRFMLLFG